MNIKNIILIQRDSGIEFHLVEMIEGSDGNTLCHLKQNPNDIGISITLNLFRILHALNTPCGAWSLKIAPEKYNLDNVVFIKAEFLEKDSNGVNETANGFNLIRVMDGGSRPQELHIKNSKYNQARVRVLK